MKKIYFITIITTVFFITTLSAQQSQRKIALDDIFREYKLIPSGIPQIESMNDGEHFTTLAEGSRIEQYSYKSGEKTATIFDLKLMTDPSFSLIYAYDFSQEEQKILIVANRENIYRHSFMADYYIYERSKDSLYPLSDHGKQQLASFSPDGSGIAYVRNNNLFIRKLNSGKEKQITHDGEKNKIINGAPDWVYEEEFGFSKGFAWSPDSRKIAFYRFNEQRVKQFNMTYFEGLYPEWYRFKYPKAGEQNSIVSIHVYHVDTENTIEMDTGEETDQYIPRIKWTKDPEILSIMRLNRLQNHVEIIHSRAADGNSEVVYEEKEEKYFSEATDDMVTYLDNGDEFILMSERDDWLHFYLYNFREKTIRRITIGDYDVSGLIGFDEDDEILYYTSHERSSIHQDVYGIRIDGKKKKRLSEKKGWNSASFSKGYRYFINNWSDANTPDLITLHNRNGKLIRTLEDNREVKKRTALYGFSSVEFFKIPVSDGTELNAYMIKPSDFEESKQYPLLMYVYGGPESQTATDHFSALRGAWFQHLTQQDYIVVCVDNRGTNGRGEEFRKATYMQLGKLETIDQIESAKYLSNLPYIDKNRIGMFGWSYGGYMSLSCLFKGSDIFNMAIAVAPVTNWKYYDTIYTERFMRTPQENPEGYGQNSPINFVKGKKGKLLLIHGMADDNVHLQNSAELIKSLVKADKQFDMQFYPNKNHGIYGGNTTFHLYSRMTDYVFENL